MRIKKHLLFIAFFLPFLGQAQERDTLKVMSYNLLNFPNVSPERIDTLKEILAYVKPDIFMVCELTSNTGAEAILFNALNEDGESSYDMADFVDGPGSNNELYFNTEKLALYSQYSIPTVLRDINEYVLYYKSTDLATTSDTTFLYVYVCHLKASMGFEEQRNLEASALKTYLDSRSGAENILVGGDFNFYSSAGEPAWNTLLNGGEVSLKDPITAPGDWHNNSGYAWLHTQSTRQTVFDGGAFGGMDDRFDFIFIGDDLRTYSNDALYIEDSYRAIGQDGFHYNDALIDAPVNLSEPSSIISNLYHMSDHLPIYLEIEIVKEAAKINEATLAPFSAFYNAAENQINFVVEDATLFTSNSIFQIYTITGQLVLVTEGLDESLTISTESLDAGTYVLRIEESNFNFKFVK